MPTLQFPRVFSFVLIVLTMPSFATADDKPPADSEPNAAAAAAAEEEVTTEPPRFEGGETESHPMAKPTLPPDNRVTVELIDGSRLIGEPTGDASLELKTPFGTLRAPLAKLRGVRLKGATDRAMPEARPLVLFENGDALTAEPQFESITLKTVFGESTIRREHIASIVRTTRPFGWSYDGNRWWLNYATVEPADGAYPGVTGTTPLWTPSPTPAGGSDFFIRPPEPIRDPPTAN